MISIGKLGAGQERYYTEKVAEGAEVREPGGRRGLRDHGRDEAEIQL